MGLMLEKQSVVAPLIRSSQYKLDLGVPDEHHHEISAIPFSNDMPLVVPIDQFYEHYFQYRLRANPIIIFNHKFNENNQQTPSNTMINIYPILSEFRQFPIISRIQEKDSLESSQILSERDLLKSSFQVIFCIREIKEYSYLRVFLNVFEYYQLKVLSYDSILDIPPSYVRTADIIIGLSQVRDLRKKLVKYQKTKGGIFCFCRKQQKEEILKGTHVKFTELRKELKKFKYPMQWETNILEIIKKLITAKKGKDLKKKQDKNKITSIYMCVQEKSQQDYSLLNAMKKLQKFLPSVKLKKISISKNENELSESMQEMLSCRFLFVVVGESFQTYNRICTKLEENEQQGRAIVLRKHKMSNEEYVENIIRMFEKNQIPVIAPIIPFEVVVFGEEPYLQKIMRELPLFRIKLFASMTNPSIMKKLKNEIVLISKETFKKCQILQELNNSEVLYICFDRQVTQEEVNEMRESDVLFCTNEKQLRILILSSAKKFRHKFTHMRYNYYQRKINAISDEFYSAFSDLKMSKKIFEIKNLNIFVFQCQKWLEFDITQRIITSVMTSITSYFYLSEGVFRIKQQLLSELFYLRELGEIPTSVIMELASRHHETMSDLATHFMGFMFECKSFFLLINRIFTQILYQNKKQYTEYLPYTFFCLFYSFMKCNCLEKYSLEGFKVKLIHYQNAAGLSKFMQQKEVLYCTAEFLLGQIVDEDAQDPQSCFISIKEQYANSYSHSYPFVIRNNLVIFPPLSKLVLDYSQHICLGLQDPKEYLFLNFFGKLLFQKKGRDPINHSNLIFHQFIYYFRKRWNFRIDQLLCSSPSLPPEILQTFTILNFFEKGELSKARKFIVSSHPYSKVFLEYIRLELQKSFNKSNNPHKVKERKKKYIWDIFFNNEQQKFKVVLKGHKTQDFFKGIRSQLAISGIRNKSVSSNLMNTFWSQILKEVSTDRHISLNPSKVIGNPKKPSLMRGKQKFSLNLLNENNESNNVEFDEVSKDEEPEAPPKPKLKRSKTKVKKRQKVEFNVSDIYALQDSEKSVEKEKDKGVGNFLQHLIK